MVASSFSRRSTRSKFSLRTAAAALALGVSAIAQAIPEAGFDAAYDSQVLPYYRTGRQGSFVREGKHGDSATLKWIAFEREDERAAIVLLPGRGESFRKYAEVIYDLAARAQVSIYAMDPRGQGYSSRETPNPQVGYVRDFQDYVDDFDWFVDHVARAKPHRHLLLVAHSMGGAISTLYLQSHPGVFDAAVFSSPMYLPDTSPYSEGIAHFLSGAACLAGQGKKYAINQHDQPDYLDPEADEVTHSKARNDRKWQTLKEEPVLKVGGASWRWVEQSLAGVSKIKKQASRLTIPTLIFQAGDDRIVKTSRQDEICSAAKACEIVRFDGAFHEILMETDAIRDRALADTVEFFAPYLR